MSTEWESMTRRWCWGCPFYLFPLIFREGETDKQREEKRLPADNREKREVGEESDSGTVSKE